MYWHPDLSPGKQRLGDRLAGTSFRLHHLDNYGNFVPGFCAGVSIGPWSELDALIAEGIDVDRHPVLRFLLAEDIEGLLSFALGLGYQESAEGYVSRCDLCLDIRRHLVSAGYFDELRPREFYEQLG